MRFGNSKSFETVTASSSQFAIAINFFLFSRQRFWRSLFKVFLSWITNLVSLFFALSFCFLSLFPARFFASVSLCFRFRNVAFDTCLKLHLSGRKHLCLTYLFSITCISI
jgi:hypothetical protein